MLNANCMLYLLVPYSRILVVIYNVDIKNENCLFLRFYFLLLDRDVGGSFEFDLKSLEDCCAKDFNFIIFNAQH